MNVLYFNINYECNNNCRFCFSHHTSWHDVKYNVSLQEVKKIISDYQISPEDRIVINGGEPTLHKELFEIVDKKRKKSRHIVMYTNGTLLADYNYAKALIESGVSRLTIPIHGDSSLHNYFTRNKRSYDLTLQGIKNIIDLKKAGLDIVLEIKFIVTQKLVAAEFDSLDFLRINDLIDNVDCVVIAGQVDTYVSTNNHIKNVQDSILFAYLNEQINNLLNYKGDINIKMEDIRLCRLDKKIQNLLNVLPEEKPDHFEKFLAYNNMTKDIEIVDYKKSRSECLNKNCNFIEFCSEIEKRYYILLLNKKFKKKVLE